LFSLLAFSLLPNLALAQTDNWVGTMGAWSDPTHWDSGVPVAGDNIVIGTASANSTDDFGLAIGTLTLSNSADSLTVADGVALNVSGTINNAGSIQLASAGSNTYLLVTGNISLSGSGKLILGTTGPNYIQGASGAGTEVLTSANTIQGAGNIGNGVMGFVNSGTINANTSAGSLFINVSAANFSNSGTLEATTGGSLVIQGPTNSFTNYNSTTSTLTGGTYTANGGNIYFTGSASGITTLAARVTQEASGQIINTTTGTNAFANLSSIPSGGVLTTTAGFTQPGAFSMLGSLNILPKTVINVGSVTNISGTTLTGGQWVLDSNLNITGTPANIVTNNSVFTLSGGTFQNTSNNANAFANLAVNKSTLRILNFAHFNTVGNLTNSGQMTIAAGCKLTIGGTGKSYSQTGGKTTMDGMIIGAVNVNSGSFLGVGSITGNVLVGGKTTGIFSPGDASKAGIFKITGGSYKQAATGKLTTAIGGTTVGTQYSQLQVTGTGTATLNGTLAAPLLGAFVPSVGQTFTVLTASSVTGTFTNTTIAINSSEHFAISYTATGVVLTVVAGPAAE
jgi:hypothetical protein